MKKTEQPWKDAYLDGITAKLEAQPIYKIEEHIPTKKYVFSHISFFDNILTSKVVESTLPILTVAMLEFQGKGWDLDDEDIKTIKDLKNFAFNCDCMIEIIEV